MAGKKRAAQPANAGNKKGAPKKKKAVTTKAKKATTTAAEPHPFEDKKYHILNLIPIDREVCIRELKRKGNYDEKEDEKYYHEKNYDTKQINMRLPINSKDMAKLRLGRLEICGGKDIRLARELAEVGLTHNAEAWISMKTAPHLVFIDGKHIVDSTIDLHNGTVLSFFGPTTYAYQVEIHSDVLEIRKRALSRIDDVLERYHECCICFQPYEVDENSDRLPIKGTCGHDMCEACLVFYHASKCSERPNTRYIQCPECNKEKAFDIQKTVKDFFLCELLKARTPMSESDGDWKQPSSEEASRKFEEKLASENAQLNAQLRKRDKELEKLASENAQLRKRNEELEKLASENAQLRKRNEELASTKPAHRKSKQFSETEENYDSNFEGDHGDDDDDDDDDDDELSGDEFSGRESEDESVSAPDTPKEQVSLSLQPTNQWQCKRCTLKNDVKRATCELCGTKRSPYVF